VEVAEEEERRLQGVLKGEPRSATRPEKWGGRPQAGMSEAVEAGVSQRRGTLSWGMKGL